MKNLDNLVEQIKDIKEKLTTKKNKLENLKIMLEASVDDDEINIDNAISSIDEQFINVCNKLEYLHTSLNKLLSV